MQTPFVEEHLEADALQAFAAYLAAQGYSESGIQKRLQLDELSGLRLDRYPIYLRGYLSQGLVIDKLIAMFLLQGALQFEAAGDLLGADRRDFLLKLGMLQRLEDGRVVSAVSLYPCLGRVFATDHRFRHLPRLRASAPAEPVMYLGGDSYALARLTPRGPVGSTLEIGVGSGVHSILARAHSQRVVGIDINPRALAFAQLNALLNGVPDIELRQGDVYGPVAGERFDRILSNPPFVPSPEQRLAFRDGGPSGEDVLARIVAGLDAHLADDGLCQIVTHLVHHGGSYRRKLEGWLGSTRWDSCIHDFGRLTPFDYAVDQVKSSFGQSYPDYRDELLRWIAGYMQQGIAQVGAGVIHLRRHPGPGRAWHCEEEVLPPRAAAGDRVLALFQRRDRVEQLDDEQLRGIHAAPPAGSELERRQPLTGGKPSFRFRTAPGPLQRTLDLQGHIVALLEALPQASDAGAACDAVSAQGHPQALLLRTLRAMLELGMLEIVA